MITNENTSHGIQIQNTSSTDEDSVTINHIKTLIANGGKSIQVQTNGAITLSYVVDYGDGIDLDNTTSANANDVTILRSKVTGVSSGTGLNVATNGNVVLDSMIANNNGIGVHIVNTTGSDATVKVLNTYSVNEFSNNSQYGLLIASNGDVSLTGVTANNNGLDGIKVDHRRAICSCAMLRFTAIPAVACMQLRMGAQPSAR